jgi:hypothetical protein
MAEPPRREPARPPLVDGYLPPPEPSRRSWKTTLVAFGAVVVLCGGGFVWFAIHRGKVRDVEAFEQMAVGTCFDWPETDRTTSAPVVPCDEPHDAEVIAQHRLDGEIAFPGLDAFERRYGPMCADTFGTYAPGAAAADTTIEVGWVGTDEIGWQRGARWVSCVASDPVHKRTGSLR